MTDKQKRESASASLRRGSQRPVTMEWACNREPDAGTRFAVEQIRQAAEGVYGVPVRKRRWPWRLWRLLRRMR